MKAEQRDGYKDVTVEQFNNFSLIEKLKMQYSYIDHFKYNLITKVRKYIFFTIKYFFKFYILGKKIKDNSKNNHE